MAGPSAIPGYCKIKGCPLLGDNLLYGKVIVETKKSYKKNGGLISIK
jgi:hypothetical protein